MYIYKTCLHSQLSVFGNIDTCHDFCYKIYPVILEVYVKQVGSIQDDKFFYKVAVYIAYSNRGMKYSHLFKSESEW